VNDDMYKNESVVSSVIHELVFSFSKYTERGDHPVVLASRWDEGGECNVPINILYLCVFEKNHRLKSMDVDTTTYKA